MVTAMADSTGSLGMTKSRTRFHEAHAEISQKQAQEVGEDEDAGRNIYIYIYSFAPRHCFKLFSHIS